MQRSLGNEYKSVNDMLSTYGIQRRAYYLRLQRGWTLEEALTGKNVTDHLGNSYPTQQELFKHYNIDAMTFWRRTNIYHMGLEEALTSNIPRGRIQKKAYDHKGTEFISFDKMCEHYNVKPGTVRTRISRGYTLEEALTKQTTCLADRKMKLKE